MIQGSTLPWDHVHQDRRSFVRHPVCLPVVLAVNDAVCDGAAEAVDVGHGGICVRVGAELSPGTHVNLGFPVVGHDWEFEACVVWVAAVADGWEVGLCFHSGGDRTRARLVEQICQIEAYRLDQEQTGRALSCEQAATEWGDLNAESFPEF